MCCKKCFMDAKIPINMLTLHVAQFLVYIEKIITTSKLCYICGCYVLPNTTISCIFGIWQLCANYR